MSCSQMCLLFQLLPFAGFGCGQEHGEHQEGDDGARHEDAANVEVIGDGTAQQRADNAACRVEALRPPEEGTAHL